MSTKHLRFSAQNKVSFRLELMRLWRTTKDENRAIPQKGRNEYEGLLPIFIAANYTRVRSRFTVARYLILAICL